MIDLNTLLVWNLVAWLAVLGFAAVRELTRALSKSTFSYYTKSIIDIVYIVALLFGTIIALAALHLVKIM